MKISRGRVLAVVAGLATLAAGQGSGSPAIQDFVSGGEAQITLESGDYTVRSSPDNRIHVIWNEANRGVRVNLAVHERSAELRVENTPNHFHATIEVPALTNLRIRLTAGDLEIRDVTGNKNIEMNAGDVSVAVGKSSDWSHVDASTTAGDLSAPPFQAHRSGLFQSFHWNGQGKYRLHVHVIAGDVNLRS